jgi:hypothetical protein
MRSDGKIPNETRDDDTWTQDPEELTTKNGKAHMKGTRNVVPLCTIALNKEARVTAPAFMLITTSTADTALQLVNSRLSRNKALQFRPAANGLPMTVKDVCEGSNV